MDRWLAVQNGSKVKDQPYFFLKVKNGAKESRFGWMMDLYVRFLEKDYVDSLPPQIAGKTEDVEVLQHKDLNRKELAVDELKS